MEIQENLAAIEKLLNSLIKFAVIYGFQIIGALVFLLIGLKVAGWAARQFHIERRKKTVGLSVVVFRRW